MAKYVGGRKNLVYKTVKAIMMKGKRRQNLAGDYINRSRSVDPDIKD